jgi:chitin disaccharide deacetylase
LKQLIVNADDFGFTRDVNRGIVEAHRKGILTAATLMANGAEFDDAADLARGNPGLDIGAHLVLIGGKSLAPPYGELPSTVRDLLVAVSRKKIRPYEELRSQIEKILGAGISVSHLDTHKHTHLFPPVLDAVARLAEEFRIPWVRRPFDLPLSGAGVPLVVRLTNHSLRAVRAGFHRKLARHGCRTTDHFAGFQVTGRLRSKELIAVLRTLPEGSTEFMCHPGFCTEELRAAATRLKESRRAELDALIDPVVRETLAGLGIQLTNYRRLDSAL